MQIEIHEVEERSAAFEEDDCIDEQGLAKVAAKVLIDFD